MTKIQYFDEITSEFEKLRKALGQVGDEKDAPEDIHPRDEQHLASRPIQEDRKKRKEEQAALLGFCTKAINNIAILERYLAESQKNEEFYRKNAESLKFEARRRKELINSYAADKEKNKASLEELSQTILQLRAAYEDEHKAQQGQKQQLERERELRESAYRQIDELRAALTAQKLGAGLFPAREIDKDAHLGMALTIIKNNPEAIQVKNSAPALLYNFIVDCNKPENAKPREYGGIGVEMHGVEVTVASKNSALTPGDKIIAVAVDENLKLPPELESLVKDNIIDLTAIKDPELLKEAASLMIRGMPGTSVELKVERDGKIVQKTVNRQFFGTNKDDELVAFTALSEIVPSKKMTDFLEKLEKVAEIGVVPSSRIAPGGVHYPPSGHFYAAGRPHRRD